MEFLDNIEILGGVKEFFRYTVFDVSLLRVASAVVIVLIFIGFKRFFTKVILKLLYKLTKKSKTTIDDQLVSAVEKPLCFFIIVAGIWLGMAVLKLPQSARDFADVVMRSLFLFAIFWMLFRATEALANFFQFAARKTETRLDDALVPIVKSGLKVLVVVIGVVTILQEWEFDVAGLLAGLGLGGLAFALAAKDTAANLFGSITIMIDRPFAIGDWIKTPHVEGTVEDLGFRSTRVRTFAQALVTIPNSIMSNDPITNWSRMGKRRISFRLGVTYSTSDTKMRECIERMRLMLAEHPEVHPDMVFVYFERFGDSALEIFLYFFTKTTVWHKFLEVQEDINLKIMEILKEMDISVAFPSTSVYIEKNAPERL
jgi:MscS family membrane protein